MFHFIDFKSDVTNLLVYFLLVAIFFGCMLHFLKEKQEISPFIVSSQRNKSR